MMAWRPVQQCALPPHPYDYKSRGVSWWPFRFRLPKHVMSFVDEIVCAVTPQHFQGVGLWYKDFSQTSDEEVRELLKRALQPQHRVASGAP
jgi:hypothetical protein